MFILPVSKDGICFLREDLTPSKTFAKATEVCKNGGYDGLPEFRHEEDTIFMAKILYCGWDYIRQYQKGTDRTSIFI